MSLLDTLNNPSMLHAALVHFPIALSVLGVPLVLASAFFYRNATLRLMAVALYVLMAVSALVAEETGEDARAQAPADVASEIGHLLVEHEDLGEKVKIIAAITAVLLMMSFIPQETFRRTVALFACFGALMAALLVALAAHHGGELVYVHGVGTGLEEHIARQPKAEDGEAAADWIPIRDIDPTAAAAVSYVRDVQPIFEEFCYNCHESPDPDGAYEMTTVVNLLKAGEKAGPGIIPGEPDESSVVEYIRGIKQPRMPKKKAPLSEDDLHTIRLWISAGAIDDSSTAETVVPDAVVPAEVVEELPTPGEAEPIEESSVVEDAPAADVPVEEMPVEVPDIEAPMNEVPADAAPEVAAPVEEAAPAEEEVFDPFG